MGYKMDAVFNIHEAKTHLSQLLDRVQQGENVVIAKAGRPIARLTPYQPEPRRIAPPGSMVGQGFWIGEDFDAPVDGLFNALEPTAS